MSKAINAPDPKEIEDIAPQAPPGWEIRPPDPNAPPKAATGGSEPEGGERGLNDGAAVPPGAATNKAVVPLRLSGGQVDAAGRREYGATLIRAGLVRQRNGTFAPWTIPASTLRQAVAKLNGIAVFVDHADWFDYPSMRNLAAVTFDAHWNEETESIDGGVRLYQSAAWLRELLDQIVADQAAGREVPDVGLSLTFYGQHDWVEADPEPVRITTSIDHVESCDIVFGPAAEGRFKEILSKRTFSERSADVQAGANDPADVRILSANSGGHSDAVQNNAQHTEANVSEQELQQNKNDVVEAGSGQPAVETPQPEQVDTDRLNRIEGQIERLTSLVAEQQADKAVNGMGQAPADVQVSTPVEQFSGVVDWLFGAPGAETPDPEYRRADAIYRALTGDYEFRGVFDPSRVQLASATTTTLPNLALNAMNKVIQVQFSSLTFWRWFERIVAVTPNDGSLHDMAWITYGGIDNLPTVAEGGSYTELDVGDVKETASFVKKGGYVGITREMIKNSDIMRIQAVPRALAVAAVRTRSSAVSTIFTTASGVGPTLDQDSKALFHADHSNLGTTAFSASEWRVVRAAMFKHTEVESGKALGVFPRFALVPADLYDSALSAFGYGEGYPTSYTPEAQDRGNDDPRPVPLAVPDWTDANNWAAIVDPVVFPVIQMSYSQNPGGNAHPLPELYSVTSETSGLMFTNDVLPIKVRDEFAVGVNGPRGIYKENVA